MAIAGLILEYVKVLAWPLTALIGFAFLRRPILAMLERLHKAHLPGGVSFDFAETVRDAEVLSREVRRQPGAAHQQAIPAIPVTQANARMLSLDLQPSPSGLDFGYYRDIATRDPNLALAGLRMEIEVLARNLAKGWKVQVRERDSARSLMKRLFDRGAITDEQFRLADDVIALCNTAVHGRRITRDEAEEVLDIADVLRDQFLAWLGWGFDSGGGEAQR